MSAFRRLSPAWGAFVLVLLVRSWVAMSRMDVLELELYSGSMAEALRLGMPLDPDSLPVIEHGRGSLVIGLLLVPLFALLGPTLAAIKLLAVGLAAATAALGAGLLHRWAGRAAGWAGALLFAFLPPAYQQLDVLALGAHGSSVLFMLLALGLVLSAGRTALAKPIPALLLGALCGMGYFCSLQFIVVLPALAGTMLAAGSARPEESPPNTSRLFSRGLPAFALPFVAFYLLAARVTTSNEIVNRSLSERLLPDGPWEAILKLGRTISIELRRSWLFEEHGGALASWFLLGTLLVALALLLPRILRREPLAVFLFLHPLGVCAAYAATDFRLNLDATLDGMGSRYMMPVYFSLAAWIALGVGSLFGQGRARLGLLLAVTPALAGAAGLVDLLDPGYAARQPTARGTEYPRFRNHFQYAGGADLSQRLDWIQKIDTQWAPWHPLCYEMVFFEQDGSSSEEELLAALLRISQEPVRLQSHRLTSLGFHLSRHWRVELSPQIQLNKACSHLTQQQREWFLRGVGKRWLATLIEDSMYARLKARGEVHKARRPTTLSLAKLSAFPRELRDQIALGLGFQFGYRASPYRHSILSLFPELNGLSPELGRSIFHGVGQGYRLRFVESDWFLPAPGDLRIEAHMGAPEQEWFRSGLAAPTDRITTDATGND